MFEDIVDINDYSEVRECDYKGEHYSVRDNGAIMRHAREGKPKRKDDEMWSFGKKDEKTGYMLFCGARVHIIVATAFYGEQDSKVYVVDHIDTNRCNNRVENLRWFTRLENALNNPATRKRIEYLCGGDIQKFINNPACLRDLTGTNQDIMWMRTVSPEEAKACFARISSWAEKLSSETPSQGGKMGEWMFKPKGERTFYDPWGKPINPSYGQHEESEEKDSLPDFFQTSNKLAVQKGWAPYCNPEFPCCPTEVYSDPVHEYYDNLKEGEVFVSASYGSSLTYVFTKQENKIFVITSIPDGVKPYGLIEVEWNGEVFIHKSIRTFFDENGARAAYTRAQGLEWTGPDSIDDYC